MIAFDRCNHPTVVPFDEFKFIRFFEIFSNDNKIIYPHVSIDDWGQFTDGLKQDDHRNNYRMYDSTRRIEI